MLTKAQYNILTDLDADGYLYDGARFYPLDVFPDRDAIGNAKRRVLRNLISKGILQADDWNKITVDREKVYHAVKAYRRLNDG